MKKVLLMLALFCPAAFAEMSGSIGAVSNYVWRGATQSDNSHAIQGSVTAEAKGLHATAWASQVDFGDDTSTRVDYQAGYTLGSSEFGKIDIGVITYTYIGDETKFADDVKEVYIRASAGPFSVTAYREVLLKDEEKASNFFSGGVDVSSYLPMDASIMVNMNDDNEVGYGASIGKTWDKGFQVAYTYNSVDESEHSFGLFYNF